MNVMLISMQENLCTFGVRYVFYAVRKDGHQVFLIYPNLRSELFEASRYAGFIKEFIPFLKNNCTKVVGISFMSYQLDLVKKICNDIKRALPRVVLVGGGIHVTAFPAESLQFFDAVCLGEGEISFTEFLKDYTQKRSIKEINIPGMRTAFNLPCRHTQIPLLLDDLNNLAILPVLDESTIFYQAGKLRLLRSKHIERFQRYNGNGYDISSSRGCFLKCTYCADNIYNNLYGSDWKKIRLRSVDHVMEELRQALCARPTIRFINFHDDSFTSRPLSWFADFVPRYCREIKLPLMFRMIPGSADEEKFRLLSQLPVIAAGIGLQSGSYRVLSEVYKRPVKISIFINTIQRLHKLSITPIIDVILNNPYENYNDIMQTIHTLSLLPKPFLLELYGFRFYPGTEMTARALKEGVIKGCDMYQTQGMIDAHSEKQFLNNIIFVAPHFPRRLIFALIGQEQHLWVKRIMPLLLIAGSAINVGYFLFMVIRIHRYNLFRAVRFFYLTLDPISTVCHTFPFIRHLVIRNKH